MNVWIEGNPTVHAYNVRASGRWTTCGIPFYIDAIVLGNRRYLGAPVGRPAKEPTSCLWCIAGKRR